MNSRVTAPRLFWIAATLAAGLFAAFTVVDTLRAVVPLWSPLPWFDEWATTALLKSWRDGGMTAAEVLFAQHNEHRILVPRLVFFADDLLLRGAGRLSMACIFLVQALHAGIFMAVLGRASPPHPGRWAVAAAVLAMMFGLRQEENFSYGFQLQFVAVFAGATLSFAFLGLAVGRVRRARSAGPSLIASLTAALLTTFTMANGLVAGYVLVAMALAARLRLRTVLVCAAWAVLLTLVYLQGYQPVTHHSRPSDSLIHPLGILVYVATYLGSLVATERVGPAAALGFAGMAAAGWAALRTARSGGASPGALAMVGVMLFVGATAVITAAGRLEFGVDQALSSRYATGSITFWSAQVTYWWLESPRPRVRVAGRWLPPSAPGRLAVAMLAAALCVSTGWQQAAGRSQLSVQRSLENASADLLMLGLDDPAVVRRAAWTDESVRRLLPTLKRDGLSIFGTADYAGLSRPVSERGSIGTPCAGEIGSAVADPGLGRDGVRVSGRALDGGRLVRRVLLADAADRVVGFASGAIPGAARGAWRGFALAPAGADLTAYGLVGGTRLCRIGVAVVAQPAAGQASQPEAAP